MVVCHATVGLQFCPIPPAFPLPEYWIDFTSPMVFCAFWITVFASWADATPTPNASNNTNMLHPFFVIIPPEIRLRELLGISDFKLILAQDHMPAALSCQTHISLAADGWRGRPLQGIW